MLWCAVRVYLRRLDLSGSQCAAIFILQGVGVCLIVGWLGRLPAELVLVMVRQTCH